MVTRPLLYCITVQVADECQNSVSQKPAEDSFCVVILAMKRHLHHIQNSISVVIIVKRYASVICLIDTLTLTDVTENTDSDTEMDTLKQSDQTHLHNSRGSLYTGLSETLISDIVNNPVEFQHKSELKKTYPFLQDIYKNISSIISQLKDSVTSY